ncbi:hypothetical protein GTH32_13840 [Alteromonas sp. 345S023]|uniref:PepSY domain-containing protein n=1 Tax=Alteromonas profundi TaxID=2696062 RepID=A0A7X5LMR4_9ALTE|nr:hypothetical protein [Alteromonas profundi]NDV92258.1 hypothetical protein [Alteromonas profundi]
MASPKLHMAFRKYHRWLGFFLAGIMAVYAISGILLIFRKTDFLKSETVQIQQLEKGLNKAQLSSTLNIKGSKVVGETDTAIMLNVGEYNKNTGATRIVRKSYPLALDKMVKLHKATHNSPLYWLNISFGVGLLFFVISAFMMFVPKLPVYKNGLKLAGIGAIVTLLVIMFGS